MSIDSKDQGEKVERRGMRERLLNTETHDAFGGLKTAIERSKQGLGTAVFCSHNFKNDMLATLVMLKNVPEFKNKEFVLPMNSMWYKIYWPGEKLLGASFIPVHSPEVRRKNALVRKEPGSRDLTILDKITVPRDAFPDVEPSLQRYLAASKKVLERGGIVIVAPQAQGNMDKMDLTHQRRTFSKFRQYMSAYQLGDYSILPIGVSYPRLARMGLSQKGSHVGEPMRIEIGKCYSSPEAATAIRDSGGNADLWIYSQIASLLPSETVMYGSSPDVRVGLSRDGAV